MNRLKILEIKRRRYEERQQRTLSNAAVRSPIEHPITYILNKQNRLIQRDYNRNQNTEGILGSRVGRVSLALFPTGYKASKIVHNDALPVNVTTEHPRGALSGLRQPPPLPSSNLQRRKSLTPSTPKPPPVTATEKQDRVVFKAVEIISEWTAAEPCFIDPEVDYGNKNMHFMDTVVQRLRTFKATISLEVISMLENANNACRRLSQSAVNSRTPILRDKVCTPSSCSKNNQTAEVPCKASSFGELSFPARENRILPLDPPFDVDIDDFVPRMSPAAVAGREEEVSGETLQNPCRYEKGLVTEPCDYFTEAEGRAETEEESVILCGSVQTSEAMLHPLWDTPDECKTYRSDLMLLE